MPTRKKYFQEALAFGVTVLVLAAMSISTVSASPRQTTIATDFQGISEGAVMRVRSQQSGGIDVWVGNQTIPTSFEKTIIVIEKSVGSRGFYVQVANGTTEGTAAAGGDGEENIDPNRRPPPQVPNCTPHLQVYFKDYDGKLIRNYDSYWESMPEQMEWKANFVHGAKYMIITTSVPV